MIETTPTLGFSEAINAAANKIFQIKGRSRRSEYWWTHLIVYISSVALTPFFGCILSLLTIPLQIRRLHDTGRSGWWWGIGAIIKAVFVIYILFSSAKLAMSGYDFDNFDTCIMDSLILNCVLFFSVIAIYDIVLLILCCIDSDKEDNKYGPSPKYINIEKETI